MYNSELNSFPQISRAFLAPKAPLVSSAASAKLSQQTSSSSSSSGQRFGVSDGGSGWKWDKGGVGMGGKDKGTVQTLAKCFAATVANAVVDDDAAIAALSNYAPVFWALLLLFLLLLYYLFPTHAMVVSVSVFSIPPPSSIGQGTSVKPDVGLGKKYQVPEYFKYNAYSYYDEEIAMMKGRVPQPKSGLSEYW